MIVNLHESALADFASKRRTRLHSRVGWGEGTEGRMPGRIGGGRKEGNVREAGVLRRWESFLKR